MKTVDLQVAKIIIIKKSLTRYAANAHSWLLLLREYIGRDAEIGKHHIDGYLLQIFVAHCNIRCKDRDASLAHAPIALSDSGATQVLVDAT